MEPGVVWCWGADLEGAEEPWAKASRRLVSHSEWRASQRFVQQADATRHLVGRALLRRAWAQAVGTPLAIEEMPTNAYGKPELRGSGWEFSISHSGRWVWLALASGVPVGLDVELLRPGVDPGFIWPYLHPQERQALAGAKGPALIRCWTRKEAVIKCVGQGLSLPLDQFCVATDKRSRDWLLNGPPGPLRHSACWSCHDIPMEAPYHLSLAAAAPGLSLLVGHIELHALDDPWQPVELQPPPVSAPQASEALQGRQ
jgi:4'-phosphopantetheinyl transferase